MNVQQMLGSIGVVGLCVIASLLLLSMYSVTVILGKYRRFRTASSESTAFLPAFGKCLTDGKLEDAVATAKKHTKSHVASVVSAGVSEAMDTRGVPDDATQVDLVARALERSTVLALSDLKQGLGTLATIGATAPFIGLFGTVVGIIHAFEGIAATGSGGIASVAGGIAEALVTTALGILVAIPAVMAFNHFTNRLERFHVEMNTTSAQFVDFLTRKLGMAHASH